MDERNQTIRQQLQEAKAKVTGRYDLFPIDETPDHYAKGIEPVKFIQSHDMSFCAGNVVKYVCRYKHKGTPLEDLNKARHYIDLMLKELE
jgi:hypothetical protein